MVNYSIHTIQLYCILSYTEYIYAKKNLLNLSCSVQPSRIITKKGITKESLLFRRLPYYGINSIEIVNIKDNFAEINLRYVIYFTLNLYNAQTHNSDSDCHIINPEEIAPAFCNIMNDIHEIIGKHLLAFLRLKRVDFCLDLAFKDQASAQEYISLLRLGIPRKHMHEHKYRDFTQHRKIAYKESLLLKCKSYEFQIYPKYLEMLNRKMACPDEASGIVRLELRAYQNKLSRLAEKYHIPYPECDIAKFLTKCPVITRNEIPKIVMNMVGQHSFYSYDSIREKIIASKYKDSIKDKMLKISLYFARHSRQNLLEDFDLPQDKWYALLKKYDALGCSPIPVPVRYSNPTYPGVSFWEQFF